MRKRRGFTIIELLMVVSVISILVTIVFSSVRGSIAEARARRAEALCQTVQSGLVAYRSQYDEWPGRLGGYIAGDSIPNRPNREGDDATHDPDKLVLDGSEVRELVKALVDEAKKGNPLMDISGLYVSRNPGEAGGKAYGYDFMEAVRGTSRSRRRMSTSEMYFGYPEPSTGRFRRFKMVYSVSGDDLAVMQQ